MSEADFWQVFLSSDGFDADLRRELGADLFETHERLHFARPREIPPVWAQDVWLEPERIAFDSISQAARELKKRGKFWSLFPLTHHRRAALIQEQLPKLKLPELRFGVDAPLPPIGAWALLDANTLVASANRWKPRPHGEMDFIEDKTVPPTRAYLKLWEALTLIGEAPVPGERCLDLGASPGGWTWVLQTCGADVMSVDKADLDTKIAGLPRVTHLKASAFAIDPATFGAVDWLCCDVICYPERLYKMVTRWLEAGACRRFVCTVKLQGRTDFDAVEKFKSIPGSRLSHLYHNKHELTWVWPTPKSGPLSIPSKGSV